MTHSLLLCLTIAGALSAQPPTDSTIIQDVRRVASQYVHDLPNFVCTQTTERQRDHSGTSGQWKTEDTIVEQLGFVSGKESYIVLTINGKPARNSSHSSLRRFRSSGEFGGHLDSIFDERSQTEFKLERQDSVNGRPVHVISYRVPQQSSKLKITNNGKAVIVGYHGLVYADSETKAVLRLTVIHEMPAKFPITEGGAEVQYDFIDIAGSKFLLPVRSETHVRGPGIQLGRNSMRFESYRKFGADSTVKFDEKDR